MMIIVALLCLFGFIASSPLSPQVPPPSTTTPRVARTSVEHLAVSIESIESCRPSVPLTRDLTRPLNGDADESPVTLCPDE